MADRETMTTAEVESAIKKRIRRTERLLGEILTSLAYDVSRITGKPHAIDKVVVAVRAKGKDPKAKVEIKQVTAGEAPKIAEHLRNISVLLRARDSDKD